MTQLKQTDRIRLLINSPAMIIHSISPAANSLIFRSRVDSSSLSLLSDSKHHMTDFATSSPIVVWTSMGLWGGEKMINRVNLAFAIHCSLNATMVWRCLAPTSNLRCHLPGDTKSAWCRYPGWYFPREPICLRVVCDTTEFISVARMYSPRRISYHLKVDNQ